MSVLLMVLDVEKYFLENQSFVEKHPVAYVLQVDKYFTVVLAHLDGWRLVNLWLRLDFITALEITLPVNKSCDQVEEDTALLV